MFRGISVSSKHQRVSKGFIVSQCVFEGCFKGVSRVFQGCFKGVSWVDQGFFKVFKGVHGCFDNVSSIF